MGTRGAVAFDNDTALDWFDELVSRRDTGLISQTLRGATGEDEAVVAAASLVAAAASEPIGDLPESQRDWIATTGYIPERELVTLAEGAIEGILEASELRDRWEESGDLTAWSAQMEAIRARLQAFSGEMPRRRPAVKRVPRVLHKLAAACAEEPTGKLRDKLREKLRKLSEIDKVSRATDFELPLGLLARHGLIAEIELLLERGADPNADPGSLGKPPLVAASAGGHRAACERLLDAGAHLFEVHLIDARTGFPLAALPDPEQAEPVEHSVCPALWAAVREDHPEVAALLVSRGARLDQTDINGETLLHKASEAGSVAVVEYLIESGVEIDRAKPHSGETPLHYGVRLEREEVVAILLRHGADPNPHAEGDGTPLDMVADDPEGSLYAMIREAGGFPSRGGKPGSR